MRKLLIPLSMICLISSCFLKKHDEYVSRFNLNYRKVTNESETFETSILNKEGFAKVLVNKDSIYQLYSRNSYIEEDKEKHVLKSFSRSTGGDGSISGYDYSRNPVIGVYKMFYANGNIMEKGAFCWFGFKVGKWYYYNRQGLLIKTIDMDAGYSFNYQSMFDYCKKINAPLNKVTSGERTSIFKKVIGNRKVWVIRYPRAADLIYTTVTLDGLNGALLNTQQAPFPMED